MMNNQFMRTQLDSVRIKPICFLKLSAAVILLALVAGCVSSNAPTFSDDVAKEGAQYNAISKKWATGKELIAKGEKRIKKGRKQISDGNENVSEGEKLIRRGNQMVRDSEQEYKLKQEL